MRERRAVGIVRVSQVAGREGESFISPREQRDRLEAACERDGLMLIDVHEELDVSGGKPLDARKGLRTAVETVERGEAQVLVAAYFDRLFRSLSVQAEVVERVEKAGGQVLAVDVGRVSSGSAGQWLSGTMLGAVAEYQRRAGGERTREAQIRAVARGVVPWPNIPPGYVRSEETGLLEVTDEAQTIRAAFDLRANGGTIDDVRELLGRRGIHRSYHGVQVILGSKLYLGEIHFGGITPNLTAHDPIVDRAVFDRVQRVHIPRGRRAKSERLLARLGVLRCGTCGARMVVGTSHNSTYWLYRCPPVGDCTQRVTISAKIVEAEVVAAVRGRLADVEGRASAERNVHEAQMTLERAQADLDAAIRVFAGLEDEQAARERLAELRAARDGARSRVEHLGSPRVVRTLQAGRDWDRLSVEGRRALIRLTVAAVRVAPGRGASRVSIEFLGD